MAPARKSDPGARFDWRRLARAGLSVWPEVRSGGRLVAFRDHARRFGYPDVEDSLILRAFRLRFRPWAEGPVDAVDAAMAEDLARRFPVDGSA
jgi:N-acetylmuramoyl-L-alanine amidase